MTSMGNDGDGGWNPDPMVFLLAGVYAAQQSAQRVIDNQNRIELDRRLRTDPWFAERTRVWRAYDADVQARIRNQLVTIWQLIGTVLGIWVVAFLVWVIVLHRLDVPQLVIHAPPFLFAVGCGHEAVQQHRKVLAKFSPEERRLLHHHDGRFHVHRHDRAHGHHPLDDPPVPVDRRPPGPQGTSTITVG